MTRTKSTKLIAVLLSLIMMLGATSIGLLSFAVDGEETSENVVLPQDALESIESLNIKNYMHFGDSMSTGYMLGATKDEITPVLSGDAPTTPGDDQQGDDPATPDDPTTPAPAGNDNTLIIVVIAVAAAVVIGAVAVIVVASKKK